MFFFSFRCELQIQHVKLEVEKNDVAHFFAEYATWSPERDSATGDADEESISNQQRRLPDPNWNDSDSGHPVKNTAQTILSDFQMLRTKWNGKHYYFMNGVRILEGINDRGDRTFICPVCQLHSGRVQHLKNHIERWHVNDLIKSERQTRPAPGRK